MIHEQILTFFFFFSLSLFILKHNTEFSPELCTVCKCKHGHLECSETCGQNESIFDASDEIKQPVLTLDERYARLRNHNRNHLKIRTSELRLAHGKELAEAKTRAACFRNERIYQFNSTWSPLRCTQCRCGFNSEVECYVATCPSLNCPNVSIAMPESRFNVKQLC
jgi:hypothetical protein